MKIGVYLTCQGKFFEALDRSGDFNIEIFYRQNFELFENKSPFPESWKDVDAFLYQPVLNPPSDYYQDENLLENFVSPRAVRVRLPYIMYTGIFPWYDRSADITIKTSYGNSWIENDVESFISGQKTAFDVLNREDDSILETHKNSIHILHQKEKESDIFGLADFIEENFRDISLFWTPNHPRGVLAYKFCAEAFRLLGLPPLPPYWINRLDQVLAVERSPILPCVQRQLGVKRENNLSYFLGDRELLTSAQYISKYIAKRIVATSLKNS